MARHLSLGNSPGFWPAERGSDEFMGGANFTWILTANPAMTLMGGGLKKLILKIPAPPASPHNIPAPLGGAGKIKMRRNSIAPVTKQYVESSEIFQKFLKFFAARRFGLGKWS